MLTQMRRGAGTWVAKLFIALLVVSFGIWGIADIFRGFGVNQLAKVGDTEITAVEFQRDYQRAIQRLSQQMGRPIPADEAISYGLPQQILSTLATDALLTDAATDFGVNVGDERVAEQIREQQAFRGPSGQFDRTQFQRILANNGMTEDAYIEDERKRMDRRQLVDGLFGGLDVPTPYLEAINEYRNEQRTVRYFVISSDALPALADPTEEELVSFYDDNKAQFAAPEYRSLTLLRANAEALADPSSVSDDDARATYERATGRFGTPETRQVQQIVFPDEAAAEAARDSLENGASMEEVAASEGRTLADVDLGSVSRDEIVDEAVADAAFGMDGPGVAIVDGRFGTVLVRVAGIEPAQRQPFEEVADQIRQEIATEDAQREVIDLYDSIEDAFAGGATMTEVAQRFGLDLRTVEAVDQAGNAPDGTPVELPAKSELLGDAFGTEPGVDNPPIQVAQADYLWYRVADIIPARDRELDEVRGQVLAAWTQDALSTQAQDLATEAVTRIRNGETMEAVAEAMDTSVQASEPFTREGSAPGLPAAAISAAFEGPQGTVDAVTGANGGRVVLEVASVDKPAFFAEAADNEPARQRLQRSLGDGLVSEYVAALERERGVQVNQQMLNQIVGAPNSDFGS
ncbi:peptidylprolyl isomerase [Amorphus coralli]|uniref:peptidylprolyl isomerase n=1 Tax=Amorphus coralli TaxID=340680 RepID=UPI00037B69A4|nr:peptidylprolyl isomerase [Amorphus coralli]